MSSWVIIQRESAWRSSFVAVRAVKNERRRCGDILALLLPPTLVDLMRSSSHLADERFAERFPDASVLFVESKPGCGIAHSC